MPVKESSATALVRFTGLGIICFNKELRRGEIAAIRDNKHTLTIKVQKPVFHEGSGTDAISYQDIAIYKDLQKDDVQIEIKAAGRPAIEGYEVYQHGNFDRLNSADAQDFRWVVNMNNLHDDATLTPSKGSPYPITKIYIGNGLFYTQKLDKTMFFKKVEVDAKGASKRRDDFGHVAETIGVKIEADEVNFTIRINGREETHTLKRNGLPFRIEISNMDYNLDAVYSDMADYYRFLATPDGNRFDLAPVIETANGEGVNQIQFCHPVAIDEPSSIDEL